MRWLLVLLALSCAGCVTKMGKDGRTESTIDVKYLAKTEVDRIADVAFDHKSEYFMLDSLNEQKLYFCARNMEIAVWKLANDRDSAGNLFLLSNELDPANRNLSFEREFGRLIGLLDFMAKVVADRNGRGLSRLTQSVATTIFFPISFIK